MTFIVKWYDLEFLLVMAHEVVNCTRIPKAQLSGFIRYVRYVCYVRHVLSVYRVDR